MNGIINHQSESNYSKNGDGDPQKMRNVFFRIILPTSGHCSQNYKKKKCFKIKKQKKKMEIYLEHL